MIGTSARLSSNDLPRWLAFGVFAVCWLTLLGGIPCGLSPTTLPWARYLRGPDMGGGVGGLLYSIRAQGLKFNLSNGRGDIVAQSDASGTLTWTASYEAYGKRTLELGSNEDRQRANTKEEDPTGLLNEGFRYRDLETGVWLSRDPAGFVDGPNLYAYVKQNPWTGWDPEGLETKKELEEARDTLDKAYQQQVKDINGMSGIAERDREAGLKSLDERYNKAREGLNHRINKIQKTAKDIAKVFGGNDSDYFDQLDDSNPNVKQLIELLEHAEQSGVRQGIIDTMAGDIASGAATMGQGVLVERALSRIPGLSKIFRMGGGKLDDVGMSYIPAPKVPTAFPRLIRTKPKTSVQGGGGLRKRWKDADGNIYEWDSQHGTVEKYDRRGRHQGEFNAETGEALKPADKARSVEP